MNCYLKQFRESIPSLVGNYHLLDILPNLKTCVFFKTSSMPNFSELPADLKQYLQNLINDGAEENQYLEFKAAGALKKEDKLKAELGKDISAFANADGGRIIYGLEESNNKATAFSFIDGDLITKEYIEQVIGDQIKRPISGILIDPVRIDDDMKKTVYIITIPRSNHAPHKCKKGFYKRQNFRSIEMEEYEIRESYHRVEMTKLVILKPILTGMSQDQMHKYHGALTFSIQNLGGAIEKVFKTRISIPLGIIPTFAFLPKLSEFLERTENGYHVFAIPCTSPIFQEEIVTVFSVDLSIDKSAFDMLTNKPVLVTLYYSNGTKIATFNLHDYMRLNGHPVELTNFI